MKHLRLLLALSMALGLAGCTTIRPGFVGIKINQTGQDRGVDSTSIVSGFTGYNPITTKIIEYPAYMQTVKWTKSIDEGKPSDESITFTSKDSMIVNADVSMSYMLDRTKAPTFYVKFRSDDIQSFTDGYLRNVVRNKFNEIAGNYTVEQIMGDNGAMLKQVGTEVQNAVIADGIDIDPNSFGFIGAPRPPQAVLDSISLKVQAAQIGLQKQNEVVQAEADAKKRVALAQGEADANRILTSSINDNLIRWKQLELTERAVNKWDGKRPTVEGGGSGLLLNVNPK